MSIGNSGSTGSTRGTEHAAGAERAPAGSPERAAVAPAVAGSHHLSGTGWTGGQYSLWRAFFGLYLAVHFAMLLPFGAEVFSDQGMLPDAASSPLSRLFPNVLAVLDSPAAVTSLLALALLASAALAVGWRDRIAALVIAYAWACLFGRNPLISNPGLPYVGWLLLAHALVPRAPYGSLEARGRTDPAGDWAMPRLVWAGAWVLMAAGYSYSGLTKLASPSWTDGSAIARVLENPLARPGFAAELLRSLPDALLAAATFGALFLEILFAPLALSARARPLLWSGMLALHLGLLLLVDFADLSLGMIVLHLFTFDPRWVRPKPGGEDVLFFDGECGLCHRFVRFALAEARVPGALAFSPLQGELFVALVPEPTRAALGDSVVVRTSDGRLLNRSEAALHVLERCGGAWRVLAAVGRLVPRPLRDGVYAAIAASRKRLFAQPKALCPLLPRHLARRFRG